MAVNLKPLEIPPPPKEGRYSVTLPGIVNVEFLDYVAAFAETYGNEAKPEDVIIAMINHHIANDADFKKWKRAKDGTGVSTRRRKAASASVTSPAAPESTGLTDGAAAE